MRYLILIDGVVMAKRKKKKKAKKLLAEKREMYKGYIPPDAFELVRAQ